MPCHSGLDRRCLLLGTAAVALAGSGSSSALAAPAGKLGDREIHILSDGAFPLPLSMVVRDRPEEEVFATLKAAGLPTDDFRNVLNVTLIKDGNDITLIDCGSGDKFLPGSGKLSDSLDSAGIDRAAVKRILLTHMHPDHFWGAVDSFDEAAFPNATYHVAEQEMAFWSHPDAVKSMPEGREMFAVGTQRVLKGTRERFQTFKPGQEVAPGITAIDTAGHTVGHISFAISGGGKSVIVLGDALTNAAISFQKPEWKSGSDADPDRAVETRKRLLDMLAKDRLPFIGYHLPVPGLGRTEARGNAWAYIPSLL